MLFWIIAVAAILLEVAALLRLRRRLPRLQSALWYLPSPPDFWSLVRGVCQAWHIADFDEGDGKLQVSEERVAGPGEFFRSAADRLRLARQTQPGRWLLVFLQTLLSCGMTIAGVRLIWEGSIAAEYALLAVWSLIMGQGYLRAAAGKLVLPRQEAWFKRHGWVHSWWMPLLIWIRLLVFALASR